MLKQIRKALVIYDELELPVQFKKYRERAVPDDFYKLIFHLFGYDHSEKSYDLCALRLAADGIAFAGAYYLCADPIQLTLDVGQAYSLGSDALQLTQEESQEYINYLNQYLPSGVSLCMGSCAQQWYLKSDVYYFSDACSPEMLFGKTLSDHMPRADDQFRLLRLFNDIQMLLYGCDLNHRRRLLGLPTLDALWLWGSGDAVMPSAQAPWSFVVSDNAVIQALARLNGAKVIDCTDLTSVKGPFLMVKSTGITLQSSEIFSTINELYLCSGKAYLKKKCFLSI